MRNILIPFVLVVSLPAAEQIIQVTPQSLDGWSAAGVDLALVAQAPQLTLPAGAQLTRFFPGGDIAVKLVSQPVFSPESADWPVVEIGTAALVFLRSGDEGKLALALSDGAPFTLPFTIKLAADGRSAEPFSVTFTRHGPVVTLSAFGQTLLFAADPAANSSQDVVVSAGADQAWSLETMTVTVSTPDGTPAASNAHVEISSADGGSTSKSSIPRSVNSSPDLASLTGSNGTNPVPKTGTSGAQPGASTLEIFTPPAVRHGRANAVRAALAQEKISSTRHPS